MVVVVLVLDSKQELLTDLLSESQSQSVLVRGSDNLNLNSNRAETLTQSQHVDIENGRKTINNNYLYSPCRLFKQKYILLKIIIALIT